MKYPSTMDKSSRQKFGSNFGPIEICLHLIRLMCLQIWGQNWSKHWIYIQKIYPSQANISSQMDNSSTNLANCRSHTKLIG